MRALQALIFGNSQRNLIRAEEATAAAQVASRSFVSLDKALARLQDGIFDLILIEACVPISAQKLLAESLWKKSPTSVVIAFDFFNLTTPQSTSIVFYGAELALGEGCGRRIHAAIQKLAEQKKSSLVPFRVMLVEDDLAASEIIEFFIQSIGNFSVHAFPDAEKALAILEEKPQEFDVVITDIRMPRFDGKMFIEAIRLHEKLKELPIIALTAYGTPDVLIDCLRLGASGFLVKPPNKNDLLRELSRARRIKNGQIPARLVGSHERRALEEYFLKMG